MTFDPYLLLAYATAIVLLLGTPGPVTVLVANSSVSGGFKAGLATIVGTNLASLILMAISFVVIQGVFAVSPMALTWLTLFGSFYLLYFAVDILRSKVTINRDIAASNNTGYFKNGFIVGISNPKDILFFIGFFPRFLGVFSNVAVSMATLVAVWMVLDYAILMVYSVFFSKIVNEKMANAISKVSGSLLLLLAVYAIYTVGNDLLKSY